MHPSSHRRSPQFTPRPLWYPPRPPPTRPIRSFSPEPPPAAVSSPAVYCEILQQPFHDPYEVLCHEFNVTKHTVALRPDGTVPRTIDVQAIRDAHMPTHALVVLDGRPATPGPDTTSFTPFAVPVNFELLSSRFSNDVGRLSAELSVPGSTLPVPFWSERAHALLVTLPTIPLFAPHPPSIPLLLLFGLGLHTAARAPSARDSPDINPAVRGRHRSVSPSARAASGTGTGTGTSALATYLLPAAAIAEFPAAGAMASVLEAECGDAELARRAAYTQGMWRNVLALGPRDARVVEVVRVAWNVTADARRIRERGRKHV